MVAAADVDAERDARVAIDDRVVELDAGIEHPVGIAAALPVALANGLVEKRRHTAARRFARIASEAAELRDFATREVDEVGEVGVASRIGPASICPDRSRPPPAAR